MTNNAEFITMHILILADCLHFLVSESLSPLSTNDFCIPGENWETEISGIGTMCEEFNTEFRRKVHVSCHSLNYDLYLHPIT